MISLNSALINSSNIDYTILTGKKVKIITEQFPGQPLETKIMSTGDNNLVLDKSGSDGKISQLIQKQNVNIQFEYKGQEIAFTSQIVVSQSGRIQVPLVDCISPMVRRKFVRFDFGADVRLTYFDERVIKSARLNKLKWFETSISNISGGGLLVFMPSVLAGDHFILLNLKMEELEFPPLILGRVCHSQYGRSNKIETGIEFITRENAGKIITASMFRNLPEAIFQFDNHATGNLIKYLEKNYRNNVE